MRDRLFDFEDDPLMAPPRSPEHATNRGSAAQRRGSRRYSRLTDRVAIYVCACVLLSPVPVALNRPSLWMVWVGLTAAVAASYLLLGYRADRTRPLLSQRFSRLLAAALVLPAFAVFQSLPLGQLTPLPLGWPMETVPQFLEAPVSISLLPQASLAAALRFTGYILFAVLVIEVSGRTDRARAVAWAVFWSVVGHAVWGLAALRLLGDIGLFWEKSAYLGVATGPFVNRNAFATFLGMGGAFGLALILERGSRARRTGPFGLESLQTLALWLALGVVYLALLQTQSRLGVAASLAGALVCLGAMRIKSGAGGWRAVAGVLGVGSVVGAAGLVIWGNGLLERALFLETAFDLRRASYGKALELIAARPWVGYGFDSFRPAFELVHSPPMDVQIIWDRAHSTYLSHWVELGVVVGTLPLVLGAAVIWRLVAVLRRRGKDYALSVGALAALLVGALHALMDFGLEMPANVILLLAIVGLGITPRATSARDLAAPGGDGRLAPGGGPVGHGRAEKT